MGACTKVSSFPERNIDNFSENVQNEDEYLVEKGIPDFFLKENKTKVMTS